jgi:phospho-N-acetylmuramoyl-pentapeptide-transferase
MRSADATFALALGGITFLLTVIWGGPLLTLLRRFRIGKQIRIDGPQTHLTKMGTPTMGGVLIVVPVLAITAFLNAASLMRGQVVGRSMLLPVGVLLLFTALGAYDDLLGLGGLRRGEGMRGRQLIVVQTLIAFLAALALYFVLGYDVLFLPAVPFSLHLGLFYIPAAVLLIVGSSNATNLTDGLDGLCGLITATAFAAYGIIALLQKQVYLVQFCFVMVGALFAFLWFNVHPAQLFMGGAGSYAVGATLGVVALMTGQWALWPVIAIIPLSVTASVALQVLYFKLTRRFLGEGRRLFKMAPLHHHFELLGWSETQVVQRFWLVGLLAAMIGVALALL